MDRNTLCSRGYGLELQFPERKLQRTVISELYTILLKRYPFNVFKFEGDTKALIGCDPHSLTEINRVVITEAAVGIHTGRFNESHEVFWAKAEDILRSVYDKLKIDLVLPQIYIVRLEVNPKNVDDARVFIGDKVCGFTQETRKKLQSQIHGVGVSFFFAATDPQDPFDFSVRVESLREDSKLIYLENTGRYFAPIQGRQMDPIKKRFVGTYEFLQQNVSDFLEQFNES